MSIEVFNFESLPGCMKNDVARQVSDYTNGLSGEQPQMLPVTVEDVHAKYIAFAAFDLSGGSLGDLAGYIGSSSPIIHLEQQMSEVGSLWVPERFRKQGVAKWLLECVSTEIVNRGEQPYAFVNPKSIGVFKSADYTVASSDELPSAAFLDCAKCPEKKRNLDGCCDTTVVLGDAKSV